MSSGKQQNFSPHARANHSNAFAQQKIRNNNIDCTPVNLDDPLSHSLSLSFSLRSASSSSPPKSCNKNCSTAAAAKRRRPLDAIQNYSRHFCDHLHSVPALSRSLSLSFSLASLLWMLLLCPHFLMWNDFQAPIVSFPTQTSLSHVLFRWQSSACPCH